MELKGLTFSYDGRIDQLKQVEDRIPTGQITTIIGPNGSGKSTLLGVMARNLSPREGEAVLDGKAIIAYAPKELARKLAVVHQHNDAPPDLTVQRLVAYGRLPHRRMWSQQSEEDEAAIQWALESTRLLDKRESRLCTLSGGERQRAWIAMALAQRTKLLFLDEPTTFLDMYHQIELLELIRHLNEEHGITIVMVLHDINQALRYSHHLIVMKEGEARLSGAPREVITSAALADIYGVKAVLREDDQAGLVVLPLGTAEAAHM
ncbi:ABC transporter ATP-binding protein [Paenibacillus daejeonensis]|uniref:ABC transporter ATP-binding protein n=1 Tax=Paenibacillus daejeonensis TaxID=135193 RepID=UPI0003649B53|nr:ABC transporter ATP-binding protein [Paenibacillus daejeonensis]